ncbi:Clp protease N-terminal domain-containing protein [Streptomyces sp. B1866]|uniref:Clp protease N-terminal domain-containing protein n=1 Tax=Streptomyces sp. B1866 TaxID=3075431 RepID=UPI00288FCF10|nr:Clp protease N-terminal domain-containing protein [Streptomyces sp. B1866]MDT3395514.1 Clp protease N-terminal domain-containing protein [Streptomyces sp. B1866]
MQGQFTQRMAAAMQAAGDLAVAQRCPELFTTHLLTVLSAQDDSTFSALLVANGVDLKKFHDYCADRSRTLPPVSGTPVVSVQPSQENAALLQGASFEMRELGDSRIGTEHVLLAALKYRGGKSAWALFNLTYPAVRDSLASVRNATA